MRRSYRQFCGLARALDVVGERWSLLIVRELLIGPARYGRLQNALPGVPTNLLADRLRDLQTAGVVERRFSTEADAVVYALTPWGQELREPVEALVRWSVPMMLRGPGADTSKPQWLLIALSALLHGRRASKRTSVRVDVEGASIDLRIDREGVQVHPASDAEPAAARFFTTTADLLKVAAGVLPIEEALVRGSLEGSHVALASIFSPQGEPSR